MKQEIIKYLSLLAIIAFLFSCKPSEKSVKLQQNYIPSAISGVYIGMSLKALKENRGVENLAVSKKGDMLVLKEELSKDSITLLQYHIMKKKLSKIIIDYTDTLKVYNMYVTKLGEPNANKSWSISIDKKLKLLIWTQMNMACIADSKKYKY